jgi:hypothetical protein
MDDMRSQKFCNPGEVNVSEEEGKHERRYTTKQSARKWKRTIRRVSIAIFDVIVTDKRFGIDRVGQAHNLGENLPPSRTSSNTGATKSTIG